MSQDGVKTVTCESPEATLAVARAIAPQLHPGDTLLLVGDVGAGKTHFARGVIRSLLKTPEDIPSPTYTIVQTYDGTPGEIWHADLYRLTDISELEELGLTQAFETAICLVEWPDRLGDIAPRDALILTLTTGAEHDTRMLEFRWSDPRWHSMLERVGHV